MKLSVISSVALLIASATAAATPNLSSCQQSCLTKIQKSSGCTVLSCTCAHVDELRQCLKDDKCSQEDQTSAEKYIAELCPQ